MSKLSIFLIFVSLIIGICGFAVEDCEKGTEKGPFYCEALIPVYHWNHKAQKCEKAYYGGCNKTPNNFVNLEECQNVAEPVCKIK